MAGQAPRLEAAGHPVDQLITLVRAHRRSLTSVAIAVVVVALGIWFTFSARSRREAFAGRALQDARAAIAAGNAPLAINDLSRLVTSYGGTTAAGEGALLLAQLRLNRGEVDVAITELQSYLDTNPPDRMRAPAHALLGAALENAGRPTEAARAYGRASESWSFDYLKAQTLLDVGRAFRLAGDTASAMGAYERILREFGDSPAKLEASLRLSELRPERAGS